MGQTTSIYNSFTKSLDRLRKKHLIYRKSQHRDGGKLKCEGFLRENYEFPQKSDFPKKCNNDVQVLLHSDRNKVETLRNISIDLATENLQLKQTQENISEEIKNVKLNMKEHEKINKTLQKQNKYLTEGMSESKTSLKRTRRREEYWRSKTSKLEETLSETETVKEDKIKTLENELAYTLTLLDDERKQTRDLQNENDWLTDQIRHLEETSSVTLYNENKKCFTPELQLCVYNLLDHNVGEEHISDVIKTCLKLAGKTPNRLPSRSTVNNMNIQRGYLSRKQLEETCSTKDNTTLHTDETSKNGDRYGAFSIRDDGGNYHVLGLREMATKSSKDTLDTLKEILADIDECSSSTNNDTSQRLLANIHNTMSDRAATEIKFNALLEDYRKEILPNVVQNYEALDDNSCESVNRLNNFFCGLHTLVHMAETCQKSLIEAEKAHFNGNPPIKDKEFEKVGEAGTLRCIRTASNAFARRGDEKSGCFHTFRTYVKPFLAMNKFLSIPLEPYRGNRFNILFVNAGVLYFLHEEMIKFLEGSNLESNRLLSAVLHDLKQPFFIAGIKALGLISKFVTSPLWKLLESKDVHILELRKYCLILLTYLNDVTLNIEDFIRGKLILFDEFPLKQDKIYDSLIQPSSHDDNVHIILSILLPALAKLIQREFKDFLPEGKYENMNIEIFRKTTNSVEKHNIFSERLFAYLDNLLRFKPNISSLTADAYTMFLLNKTGLWLQEKKENEIEKLVSDARKSVPNEREKFRSRAERISAIRKQKQIEEFQKYELMKLRRQQKLERVTEDIIKYGLWKLNKEMNASLKNLKFKSEKLKALKVQLRFRKDILKQKAVEKVVFSFSRKDNDKRRQLTFMELKANLSKLLKHARCHRSEA